MEKRKDIVTRNSSLQKGLWDYRESGLSERKGGLGSLEGEGTCFPEFSWLREGGV